MTFMRRIAGAATLGVTLLLGTGPIASPAQAGYVVTLQEAGSDVIATGSGPIDLTGLSPTGGDNSTHAVLEPVTGLIVTGPTDTTDVEVFTGYSGPTSFGSGGVTEANSGSGDAVGISPLFNLIAVPLDYDSGDPLSNTATYDGETFNSLGVTPGIYVWTWGEGENQNFTLIIATVPEPASAALLGMALAGLMLAGTIRRIRHAA
jgi:hypothetical protein